MEKWEYKVLLRVNLSSAERILNPLGAEGWELVSFQTNGQDCVVTLKRRKP